MNKHTHPSEDPILEWTAQQHAHYERGRTWYIAATCIVIALVGYSIWTRAWTFTVLIIALTGLYWKMHTDEPPKKQMRIWKRGFAINNDFNDWNNCKGYWIFRSKDYAELHIEKGNNSEVKIQTGNISSYVVHETLAPLLEELTDRKEHILDTIIRICKL